MTATATADLVSYGMYVDGGWIEAAGGERRESIDPYSGEAWARVADGDERDVERAVAAARTAFDEGPWSQMTGKERGRLMRRLADLIRANSDSLAEAEVRDNGKLLREMDGQLQAIPDWYEYFAGWADKIAGDVIPTDRRDYLVYTEKVPVGVVAGITAWNSPLLLLAYKLAPALAAGCTFVLKPSEHTPVSSLRFAELLGEAGFPPGVFNVVTGDGARVGAPLVGHPNVDKVAFTGSSATGVSVARAAASHLAPASLELGGKSPNIVFADADLDAAALGAVAGIFAAGGQTCVAGSRILVERPVLDEFLEKFSRRGKEIVLGDPSDPATEMGPMAFADQRDKVIACIDRARADGARVVTGGGAPQDPTFSGGLFVEPTVLADLDNDAWISQNEVFGPVASVIAFEGEDEAVRLANDVQYGLAAGIWTRDVHRAHRIASKVRAGTVWINSYRAITYSVPFGGFKDSGIGRENGREAVLDYTENKSIWVELTGQTRDPFKVG